jgi:hypothetical protein
VRTMQYLASHEKGWKTVDKNNWVPKDVPLDKPSAARIYDYLLGGYHNFESDRVVSDKLLALYPNMRLAAQVNRAFLRRTVQFLVGQGIEQFLDIGSGIPTVGNVHEIAQSLNPAARVAYVDLDPIAVSHSQSILVDNPNAIAVNGDVRKPETILELKEIRDLIDLEKPLGLLLVAVLHYVLEDEVAYRTVTTLKDSLAAGSYMAIAHATYAERPADLQSRLDDTFRAASDSRNRTQEQIERFFAGLEVIEPGLVYTPLWRPEGPDDVLLDDPGQSMAIVGVGRKG